MRPVEPSSQKELDLLGSGFHRRRQSHNTGDGKDFFSVGQIADPDNFTSTAITHFGGYGVRSDNETGRMPGMAVENPGAEGEGRASSH